MRHLSSRPALVAGALLLLLGSSGCTRLRSHQGFVSDPLIVDSVVAGVDNRASVEGSIGRPTFVSQFGPEIWYYVSRNTKQLAYSLPKPTDQLVLQVQFDAAGNVASVKRTGIELVSNISPVGDKTPTLGRKRSLFDEIFGNIGAVGAAGAMQRSPDNTGPNGI